MESYPKIVGESETLNRVLAGQSIARFGDGEFRLALGAVSNVSQIGDVKLRRELLHMLRTPSPYCIVGIPNMDPALAKGAQWNKYADRWASLLTGSMRYYSAFISRPDSAHHIATPEYFDRVQSLWMGQDVTLVANGVRSLTASFLMETGARSVNWVQCDYRDAYLHIDQYEHACRESGRRTILCGGAMATALAYRLAPHLHAIDLGHIGMFWRRYNIAAWNEQREINQKTGVVEPNP